MMITRRLFLTSTAAAAITAALPASAGPVRLRPDLLKSTSLLSNEMHEWLCAVDWASIARSYNGNGGVSQLYETRMREAFLK